MKCIIIIKNVLYYYVTPIYIIPLTVVDIILNLPEQQT